MSAAAGALRPAVRNDTQRQGREQAFTTHSYAQRADAAMPRRRGSGVSSSETYTGTAMIDSTPVDSTAMSHSGGRSTSYQAQLNSSVHSQGNISSETHETDVSAAKNRSNSAKVAPGSRRASIAEKAGHSRQRDGTSRKRGGTRTKIFWADERGEMLTIVCDTGARSSMAYFCCLPPTLLHPAVMGCWALVEGGAAAAAARHASALLLLRIIGARAY